jgi:hypothetical protein
MTESPAVITLLALRKELEDFRRTGSKRALFESLGEDLCRRYKTDSPEKALLLAMGSLMKEALPVFRKADNRQATSPARSRPEDAKIDAMIIEQTRKLLIRRFRTDRQ